MQIAEITQQETAEWAALLRIDDWPGTRTAS